MKNTKPTKSSSATEIQTSSDKSLVKSNEGVKGVHQEHGHVSEEHAIRVQKVEALRAQGIEPWPQTKPTNAVCHDIVAEFEDAQTLSHIEGAAKELSSTENAAKKTDTIAFLSREYQIAGRIISSRGHGKTVFAHLQDSSGVIQIYIKEDIVGTQQLEFFKHMIDIGDFIWVSGKSFKTNMGEITLRVESFVLISKCLHPLPEKFHGLTDVETKYRQRYLDLISSSETRARFKKRSEIIRVMRQFFDAHGFMEVETPMLHPIAGGAAAHPFVTHHNALNTDLYLRIAPELYLKRLVVGGFERVYEINRNFRNEGISTRHNPEFTMVEFYAAYLDYQHIMDFVEQMLKDIAHKVCGTMQLAYGDYRLDFSLPFERISMHDSIIKYGGCTPAELAPEAIDTTLKKHAIILDNKSAAHGYKIAALFEKLVESTLIQPTFITDFPIEISPLAKRNASNPTIADRFELFIVGMEFGNGFNELNDPFDQEQRLKEQSQARESGDTEAHRYDAEFITALEYGLPPTVGVGIGIDRLTMLLTNTTSIKDVILFPTLKRKV